MATTAPNYSTKGFWQRPEGVTGAIFLAGIVLGGGYLLVSNIGTIMALTGNILALSLMLIALAAVIYMVLDPKMRNLVWYMYKSVMRSITGLFVKIDPIGILKSYVEDLEANLGKMSQQIGKLRGQSRKLEALMKQNDAEITKNMKLASAAKAKGDEKNTILATRKAARMRDTNAKYSALNNKMDVMYRILKRMYENSEVLLEDTRDQVTLKEQERKVILTSHSAMKSAMSVISGDPDKRAMFDAALEHIADDVANKVGEMEHLMEMSSNFMDSVDLQNGVFEEEGMRMLEQWEKKSSLLLMGENAGSEETLDLNRPAAQPEKRSASNGNNSYDNLFN
jgi:phage shock protein A